jgi:hypothetical protein
MGIDDGLPDPIVLLACPLYSRVLDCSKPAVAQTSELQKPAFVID